MKKRQQKRQQKRRQSGQRDNLAGVIVERLGDWSAVRIAEWTEAMKSEALALPSDDPSYRKLDDDEYEDCDIDGDEYGGASIVYFPGPHPPLDERGVPLTRVDFQAGRISREYDLAAAAGELRIVCPGGESHDEQVGAKSFESLDFDRFDRIVEALRKIEGQGCNSKHILELYREVGPMGFRDRKRTGGEPVAWLRREAIEFLAAYELAKVVRALQSPKSGWAREQLVGLGHEYALRLRDGPKEREVPSSECDDVEYFQLAAYEAIRARVEGRSVTVSNDFRLTPVCATPIEGFWAAMTVRLASPLGVRRCNWCHRPFIPRVRQQHACSLSCRKVHWMRESRAG